MSEVLLQGDCLELMRDIPDNSIDMICCDPPYGTTQCKWDSIIPLDLMWNQLLRIIKPNGAIILFAGQPFTSILITSQLKYFKYTWTWKKTTPTGFLNAKKEPLRVIEDVCIFYKAPPTYNPQFTEGKPYTQKSGRQTENYGNQIQVITENDGKRYPLNILEYAKTGIKVHPTQKPVPLLEYLIKTYTQEGEVVLDFTMGSGSTGVASKNLKRDFIGIELDEKYFGIAYKRIQEA